MTTISQYLWYCNAYGIVDARYNKVEYNKITYSTAMTKQDYIPSNPKYKSHQIQKLKCSSSHLITVFAQSIEAKCQVENQRR